jgi:hypothetical protein
MQGIDRYFVKCLFIVGLESARSCDLKIYPCFMVAENLV